MVEPIIRIKALSFAYPGGTKALDGIQLKVEAGESIGVVGPNGAGKTTLFLCLSGVLAVRPGMIQIAGLDPAVPPQRRSLPAKVGIVFQNSEDQLFNATVFDDVAFGPLQLGLPAEEVRRRTEEAIAQAGLRGREQRVPFHLSGGEKRRAALAGVLAMRPDVLLLDEPSQFLDPRGRRELIHLIRQLPQTKIIAAHDLDMIVDTCQRVVVVDRGQIAASGPAHAILADANLMEAHGLEVPYRLRLSTPAERG